MPKVGQQYKRKARFYTLKNIESTKNFTYYWMLEDGLKDIDKNCRVYGSTVFHSEFNLIRKEVEDGSNNSATNGTRTTE